MLFIQLDPIMGGREIMKIALNTYSLRKEWAEMTQKSLDPVVNLCKMCGITEIELFDRHYNNDSKKLTEVQKELEKNLIYSC